MCLQVFWGHSKVADNSFPNLIPMLTGKRVWDQQPDMMDEFDHVDVSTQVSPVLSMPSWSDTTTVVGLRQLAADLAEIRAEELVSLAALIFGRRKGNLRLHRLLHGGQPGHRPVHHERQRIYQEACRCMPDLAFGACSDDGWEE